MATLGRGAAAIAAVMLAVVAAAQAQQPAPSVAAEAAPESAASEVPLPDPGAPEGAVLTARSDRPFDSYALPVAPYTPDTPGVRDIAGRVVWSGFRLNDTLASTADIMQGYRARLAGLGFQPLLDCANAGCGGFDFRFAVQLLPPPAMLVDTADFAQYSGRRSEAGGAETFVSILVSRLLGNVHVQTVVVAPSAAGTAIVPTPVPAEEGRQVMLAQDEAMLLEQINAAGHVSVQGLIFETGGATLSPGSAPALDILAQFLMRNQDLSVVIVGHSDNQGSLEANIALSKRRAESVRDALVERGVTSARLDAQGVGYLAPVASNATDDGRAVNRRVELVLR